jgi:hypothetical protein
MIEINLLPQGLRPKKHSLEFEANGLFYIILLVFGILIVVHVCLVIASIIAGYQFRNLGDKWKKLEPERKIIESVKKEYTGLSKDTAAIQQFIKDRVIWAEKLNLLSSSLPSGIWFNEIRVSGKDFILKGSVFSLVKQELGQINKFLSNLKTDNDFFQDFLNLELGPVQKTIIGSYEVAEFTINGKLK